MSMTYRCFVCDEVVAETDEFEWHGLDGEKIHKRCAPKLQQTYHRFDTMTDAEFSNYLRNNK